MSAARRSRRVESEEGRLDRALAYLLASTKRSKRQTQLLKVARELAVARRILGSLKAVAQRVGISQEMLREFASVDKLSPDVKDAVADGRITSVDVAYRLSMLPPNDQTAVAEEYLDGQLSLTDVRDIASYRRRHRERPIREIIDRVRSVRTIRRYIVKFTLREMGSDEDSLFQRFGDVVGEENIVSLSVGRRQGTLILSSAGEKLLRAVARERRQTKRELVAHLIREV